MRKQRPKLRIVGHKVVSRSDPTKVLGTRPEDFPLIVARCKAAIKTLETGELYVAKAVVGK